MTTDIIITNNTTGELIDVREYNAALLSYAVEEGEPDVTTWRTKAMTSTGYGETNETDATMTLELEFVGNSQSRIIDNYHRLVRYLHNCTIKFSQEEDKLYECILKKYSHSFNNAVNMTGTFEFTCGKYSDETRENLTCGMENIITVGGALHTPVSVYVDISGTVSSLTVTIDGHVIEAKSISKSAPSSSFVIDSANKLMTIDENELCTSPVVYFPAVIGYVSITITSSDNSAVSAYAVYKERWI